MSRSRLTLGPLLLLLAALAACGNKEPADVVASAQTEIDKGNARAAVIELKAALQAGTDTGAIRLMLGKAMLRSGDASSAAIELQKALDQQQPKEEVATYLADALLLSGQAKKATDAFGTMVLADAPSMANLKATLGVAYMHQGQLAKARESIDAALAANPKQLGARVTLSRLMGGEGKVDEALQVIDAVLAEEPRSREAQRLKGELLWIGKADPKGALAIFKKMLETDKTNAMAFSAINGIHLQLGDVEGLRADVARMKAALPNDRGTKYYEARLALVDRNFPTARALTADLLKAAPEDIRLLGLAGLIESQSGSLVLAESHLVKAMQLAPRQADIRHLLVQTYLRLGQNGKAIEALQPLISGNSVEPQVLALAAQAYIQAGDTQAAETYFRRAAKARPEDLRIKTAIALVEISRGATQSGFNQLETMSSTSNETFIDMALINARLRSGDLAGAAKAAVALQAKDPKAALPAHMLGGILLQQNKPAEARASFEKALENDPSYFPSTASLARLDMQAKKPELAKRRLEAVLATNAKHSEAIVALADVLDVMGAPAADIRTKLDQAIQANPGEPRLRARLIDHLLAQRDFKSAITVARDADAALPGQLVLMDSLARAQLASGEPQQALVTFRKIVEARPNAPEPYMRLASAHLQNKDKAAAAQNFRRALEIKPSFLPAQAGLLQVAMSDGRSADALAIARQVQKQRPAEAVGFMMEGDVHVAEKRWPAATTAFRSGLQKEPSTGNAIKLHSTLSLAGQVADADRFATSWVADHTKDAHFRFHLGMFALANNDLGRAETLFRSVVALSPERAAAHNNLAWALLRAGKPGALAAAEEANRLAPESPILMDTLAAAALAEGQAAKALEIQKKVVAREPEVPAFRLTLAQVLVKSGDKAAAKAELEKLAWLGDKFPAQREVAALLKQTE